MQILMALHAIIYFLDMSLIFYHRVPIRLNFMTVSKINTAPLAKSREYLAKKTYTSQIPDFCMRFWLRKSIVCFFIRNPSMRLQNLECDIWSGLIRHYRSSPQSTKKSFSQILNPIFTIKHMKSLVGITDHGMTIIITHHLPRRRYSILLPKMFLKDALIKDINGSETKEIDMLLWCSKAALDLVGQGVLGHQFGILKGIESEYSHAIKSCNPAITQAMPFLPIFSLVYRFVPTSLQRKLAEWVPIQLVRKLKNIVDIQDAQAKSILMQKRKALNEPGASNNARDIMSLLLKANSEADQRDQLPENQILGQMNTLMLAGHETTSGALSLVLQLLSLNIPLQERLREELQKAPSILSYEELSSLPYLDAVCKEVLRLYPPAPFMERVALKDWVVPLRYPLKGKDGNTITDIKVKKGTSIYVSFRGANRCKETWGEDADEFKPERWLKFLPNSVYEAKTSGIYSSMMTFSAGPRSCIGFKFSLLELSKLT
ncbi:unnamed protein product, partial [Rhizoctonia solani]